MFFQIFALKKSTNNKINVLSGFKKSSNSPKKTTKNFVVHIENQVNSFPINNEFC